MRRVVAVLSILLLAGWLLAPIPVLSAPPPLIFSATGDLGTARFAHKDVLLPNGKVLVVGGRSGHGPLAALASAELYDPATGTWSSAAPMPFGRLGHHTILLPNGTVLVIGGSPSSNVCLSNTADQRAVQVYDPAANSWSVVGNLNVARNSPAAVLLPNGKILVSGGSTRCGAGFNSAELFDPATGTSAATGSMGVGRDTPASVLLSNGKVLVVGGFNTPNGTRLASAEIYDPATGTWSATGSMSQAREWDSVDTANRDGLILLANGKVLTAGGSTGSALLSAAEVYNPATGTWSSVGSMGSPRSAHRMTRLATGHVLVTGGSAQNTSEIFDPATNTFSPSANLVAGRLRHTATLLANGRVLLAAGDSGTTIVKSAELGLTPFVLTVTKLGTGTGTVTSTAPATSPPGIDCGTDCTEGFAPGTAVTLTATAAAGSDFTVWSAGCTNANANATGICQVTMDAAKTIRATFKPEADLVAGMTESADPAQVGVNLTYTVTVRNLGPGNATGVTVTDTLPAALTYVSATPSQGTCSTSGTPIKVTCALGIVNNGASATIAIVVTPNAAGSVTNSATVASSAVADAVSTNNVGKATTTVIP